MNVQATMADLASLLGLHGLHISSAHPCRLHSGKDVNVDMELMDADQQLRLTSTLGPALLADEAHLYSVLLLGNLLLSEHGKPCLAYEPTTGSIALTQVLDLVDTDARQLESAIDLQATLCREMRKRMVERQLIPA
jgi:hypothetical protein